MTRKIHVHASDLRGASRLTADAVAGLTSLVEAVHRSIAGAPATSAAAPDEPAPGIAGLVYRSIRGVTGLVDGVLDAVLARRQPLLGEQGSTPEREAVLAALNGVLGDYLADTCSPLALPCACAGKGAPWNWRRRHWPRTSAPSPASCWCWCMACA